MTAALKDALLEIGCEELRGVGPTRWRCGSCKRLRKSRWRSITSLSRLFTCMEPLGGSRCASTNWLAIPRTRSAK